MKWKIVSRQEAVVRAYALQEMLLKENPLGTMGEVKLIAALIGQAIEDALSSNSWEGRTARRWFDRGEVYLWTSLIGFKDTDYMKLLVKEAVNSPLTEDVGIIYRNLRRD